MALQTKENREEAENKRGIGRGHGPPRYRNDRHEIAQIRLGAIPPIPLFMHRAGRCVAAVVSNFTEVCDKRTMYAAAWSGDRCQGFGSEL